MARVCLLAFGAQLRTIKEQILEFDRLIRAWHRSNEMSMRLDEAPGVGPVLRSPLLAPARRLELAQTLTRELALSELLGRFVGLLAEHQRLAELPGIHTAFQRLLDAELGRVRVAIRSATPLEPPQPPKASAPPA